MVNQSDEPLTKVHINLYATDVAYLRQTYGQGWTEQVRLWTRDKIRIRAGYNKMVDKIERETK